MELMKKLVWAPMIISLAVLFLAFGCNKPTAEMERAEAAIDQAKSEGATQAAASLLAGAESALAEGKDLMESFQYKQARASFEEAYRLALKAKDVAHNAAPGDEPKLEPVRVVSESRVRDYVVTPGDCLWTISDNASNYGDPFQWPLIYDGNRGLIDDRAKDSGLPRMREDGWAHWIFPDQSLRVPLNQSLDDIKDARRRAGAPAPYLPPGG